MADARISQEALEVVVSGQPAARISQETLEVVVSGQPDARISQLVFEVVVSDVVTSTAYKLGLAIS